MRKKRASHLIILLFSSLILLVLIKVLPRMNVAIHLMNLPEHSVLGMEIIDDGETVLNGKTKSAGLWQKICIDGVPVPYDEKENTLYLAQNVQNAEWMGLVTTERGYQCYAKEDTYWSRKQDAIQESHVFTVWCVGKDEYAEFSVIVSGMPIVNISTEYMEVQPKVDYETDPDKALYESEDLYYGQMVLHDPGSVTGTFQCVQSRVSYHIKGATSKFYPKQSYSLKLIDQKNEKNNISLLGMRSDASWKLNSLYSDANRIREITASQIWEKFDETNPGVLETGPRMEYIEVVLDNEYQGVYCLVEPVDEKKLELNRSDVLYKVVYWDVPADEDIANSINKGWKLTGPIRIRYPEEISDYNKMWHPIRDYLNVFYRTDTVNEDIASSLVDENNLFDMTMFLATVSASDNHFKNIYYVAKTDRNGNYKMIQVPWDLDYTFGNRFSSAEVGRYVAFDENISHFYVEVALPQLMQVNAEELGPAFMGRWNAYRADFLQTEEIEKLLMENREYLIATGAAYREAERWPESKVDMDIEELLEYQRNRMEWLDQYFEKWTTP